ncbi:hypothetical protein MPSEU_000329500 [Mayamaea pseudoterrestris]|nr:hypothetical protein MPSEU_000329500 [Mayamaea pseudoterrestris]
MAMNKAEQIKQSAATPTTARSRAWHQSSLNRRITNFVRNDLDTVAQQSVFLQQPCAREHALLSRHEIMTGAQLGRGGFANVFEVRSIKVDAAIDAKLTLPQQLARRQLSETCVSKCGVARYAIKHLQPQLYGTDRKAIKNFAVASADLVVEGAFLSRMDHEHVLNLRALPYEGIDALLQGKHDSYFLLLDKLDGTLDQSLQRWKLQSDCATTMSSISAATLTNSGTRSSSMDTKLEYALQLSEALEYLHENRILFRDLKPHNIGLKDGKIRLFDFGLVREYPASARVEDVHLLSFVGTRRYSAPEIVNSSKYNAKADVYSWSLVLWEMLALERPFALHSVEDHRKAVCVNGERPELDHDAWPASVCELLRACWTANVSERLAIQETRTLLESIVEARKMYLLAAKTTVIPNSGAIEVVEERKEELVDYDSDCSDSSRDDDASQFLHVASTLLTGTYEDEEDDDDDEADEGEETFLTNQDWIIKHASALLTLNEDSENNSERHVTPMGDWSVSSRSSAIRRPAADDADAPPLPHPLQFSVTV